MVSDTPSTRGAAFHFEVIQRLKLPRRRPKKQTLQHEPHHRIGEGNEVQAGSFTRRSLIAIIYS